MLPDDGPQETIRADSESLQGPKPLPTELGAVSVGRAHNISSALSKARRESRSEYRGDEGRRRPVREEDIELQYAEFFKTERTKVVFLTEELTTDTVVEPASFDWGREYRRSYSPSSFTQQHVEVASNIQRKDCPDCSGTGRQNCDVCQGSGKRDCPQCGGDGKDEIACGCTQGRVTNEYKCENCQQTGTVTVVKFGNAQEEDCPMCEGEGSYTETETCRACGGDSVKNVLECQRCTSDPPPGEVKCTTCDIRTNEVVCEACDGEGERLHLFVHKYDLDPVVESTTNLPESVSEHALQWPDSTIVAEETVDGAMTLPSVSQPDGTIARTKRTTWSYFGGYEFVYSAGSQTFTGTVYGDEVVLDEVPYMPRSPRESVAKLSDTATQRLSGAFHRLTRYSKYVAVVAVVLYFGSSSGTPLHLYSGVTTFMASLLVCIGVVLDRT